MRSDPDLQETSDVVADIVDVGLGHVTDDAPGASLGGRGSVIVIQLSLIVGVILAWELGVRLGILREFFFGRPGRVLEILVERAMDGRLASDIHTTGMESLVGFSIGTIGGFVGALSLWWTPLLARALTPFAVALNALPKLALAPLFIIWFGLGFGMKAALSVSLCILITFMIIFSAVQQVDRDLLDMARALGASRWTQFRKIVIPSIVPALVTSMHINIGLALVGAVAGEFIASQSGLGHMALQGANVFNMSIVFGAVVVLLVIAYGAHLFLRLGERLLLPWKEASSEMWF